MSIFLGILIAVIALIFAFQNNEVVNVSFINLNFEGSLALVILASLLVGFIVGLFVLIPSVFRASKKMRQLKKDKRDFEHKSNNEGIVYESDGLGAEGSYKHNPNKNG